MTGAVRHPRPRSPSSAALLLVLVLTGCGSTVPQQRSTDAGSGSIGDGLGPVSSSVAPGSATGTAQGTGGLAGSTPVGPGSVAPGSGQTPSSVTDPGRTGTGVAPAPTRGPLTIGVVYTDTSAAASSFGVSTGGTVTAKSIIKALVAGLNAQGGLLGRRVVTVEYAFSSTSSNYSQDAAAACATFTEDNHVPVVLDFAFGNIAGFQACLQKAGVLHLTPAVESDRSASTKASLHANTGYMNLDRTYSSVLTQLAATGYLSKSNTFGLIVEQCPETQAAYRNTIVPLISRLGLKAARERTIDCTTGFASAGPASAAISSAILAFQQAGVDRVMFMSAFESVVTLVFAQAAENQGYRPGYALSSYAVAGAQRANAPAGQQPQLHGVGNIPAFDTEGRAAPSTVEKRCESLAKAGGLTPSTPTDYGVTHIICGPFLLLEAALARTGGQSAAALLQGAIANLGSSFVAPGIVGGFTNYTATQHDGPSAAQVFGYQASCGCMRYTGQPVRVPA